MLEYKIQQEQIQKERQEQKIIALNKARDLVDEMRADAFTSITKKQELKEQRLKDAMAIKYETFKN